MSRYINTDGPGKRRNQLMRTCAELLRRLSQKGTIDADSKNMLSMLVFSLRDIDAGIEESSKAWEKRDYWMKAEEFRQRWSWSGLYADTLSALIYEERWGDLPDVMLKLLPYFAEIKVTKFTRDEKLWSGDYAQLMDEKPAR